MKICPKCGVNERRPRYGWCAPCHREYTRTRYASDPVMVRRELAVSVFRKFRDDPQFWTLIEEADKKGPPRQYKRKVAAA